MKTSLLVGLGFVAGAFAVPVTSAEGEYQLISKRNTCGAIWNAKYERDVECGPEEAYYVKRNTCGAIWNAKYERNVECGPEEAYNVKRNTCGAIWNAKIEEKRAVECGPEEAYGVETIHKRNGECISSWSTKAGKMMRKREIACPPEEAFE